MVIRPNTHCEHYCMHSITVHDPGMIQMFHRLYERPENKLNPFEMELKYNYPNADEWLV